MGDLVNRKRACDSVDKEYYEMLTNISKTTEIPRSRLLDKAIMEFIEKHYPEYIKK